jgi:hypothetical protein
MARSNERQTHPRVLSILPLSIVSVVCRVVSDRNTVIQALGAVLGGQLGGQNNS